MGLRIYGIINLVLHISYLLYIKLARVLTRRLRTLALLYNVLREVKNEKRVHLWIDIRTIDRMA